MILLCGIRSETPLAMVAAALDDLGAPYRVVHQRDVADYAINWRIDGDTVDGELTLGKETIELRDVVGVYMRLMDDRLLPELAGLPPAHSSMLHARAFHEALFRWSEIAPSRVINRAGPQASNGSKPYQAQLIAVHGLMPPPTLITNDPAAVHAFRAEHGAIIYKSISAVRSVVKTLDDADLDRLDRIAWCPVQFQAKLDGVNIRVHVVGEKVFATEIESTHVDYRYAKRHGGETTLRAISLPRVIKRRCVDLTRDMGLVFSGIDLMHTSTGDYYCFEVNPSPAFSYFEANTGQKIAMAVARHLAGRSRKPARSRS